MIDIIGSKYKDFKTFSSKNKNIFLESKPFPYIELDSFFNEDYLNQILDSFPKMSEDKHDFKMSTKAEVKLAIGSPEKIPNRINSFIEYLNSIFWHHALHSSSMRHHSSFPLRVLSLKISVLTRS